MWFFEMSDHTEKEKGNANVHADACTRKVPLHGSMCILSTWLTFNYLHSYTTAIIYMARSFQQYYHLDYQRKMVFGSSALKKKGILVRLSKPFIGGFPGKFNTPNNKMRTLESIFN